MTRGAGRARDPERAARSTPAASADPDRDIRFRATLLRVLLVQAVALSLLWLLQATYHG